MKCWLSCFCLLAPPLSAATWNLNANGSWNVNANWTAPAIFPNAIDATAIFGNVIAGNRTVTLGIPITVGTASFDDNNRYTISANTLTFQVSVGNASLNVTNVNGNGAHIIASAVSLASNLVMTHSSTASFSITGAISGAGSITKNGTGAGALVLGNGGNSYGGATIINQGSLDYDAAGCIPTTSAVTVGNGVDVALLRITAVMGAVNAFDATVNTSGSISPNNNRTTFLSSLQGSGSVVLPVGGGNANQFNISGSTSTTFSGTISGGATSGSTSPAVGNRVIKGGTSTLTLTGSSTYVSRTFIENGIINLQSSTGLGSAVPNTNVFVRAIGTQGSLYVNGNGLAIGKTIFLNGSGFASGALRNMGGNNTISGNIQIGWTGGAETPATDVTIQVDSGTQLTLSGVISGSNNLTLTGGGTAIYGGTTNANTMSGTTTINAGVLQLNKNAGITSLAADAVVNSTASLTLAAANQIANTAFLTLSGGTFNMGGNTDTIGRLIFNAGTLSQGGALLSLLNGVTALSMRDTTISGNLAIAGGGSVIFDNTNNGTATISGNIDLSGFNTTFNIADGTAPTDMLISGIISNGGVIKTGAGTLVLTGANNYAGGTLVSVGTLEGNATGLQGNITNNSNLVFNQMVAGTYAGSMSGTGSLVKNGTGTLTLSDNNMVGSTTTVNAGTFLVNGSLGGAGAMTVASGATLGGTGTISKNVIINGILSPGNSIGTIHFVGAETLAAGSTLEIEFNPTTSDLVDIVGTLTIEPGATLTILPDPGMYSVPVSYTIVQTTGGVLGTFSTVTSPLPLFQGSVIYTPLDVLLQVSFIPFSNLITHGNAAAVAHCLDILPVPVGSDLELIVNTLRMLPSVSEIEEALIQMQPSALTSLAIAQEDATLYVNNAILNRLDLISHSCQKKTGNHLWISPLGGYATQSSHTQEPGFETATPGIAIGFDNTFAEQFCLGTTLSYTYSHLHWKKNRGNAHIQAIYAALYGKWFGSIGYLESALMGAYDFYHTDRHITFSSIDRHAKGSHGGQEGSFHFKGALTFNRKETIFSPFARLDYLFLHENQFKESGAKSLNLKVKSKHSDLLQTEIGIDISHCFGTVTPFFEVSALRESRFTGKTEKAFLGKSCLMTVKGLNPSRTLAALSLGVNATFSKTLSDVSFLYRGKYGSHFQDHSVYLQFGIKL